MAEYIMDLRKIVGHRPLLQCGASILLENSAGEILLEKRTDNGAWCYPGGSVELFERTEDAARRELTEETGLTAGALELFGVFSGPEYRYTYPNGDEVSNVDVVYLCRDWTGALTPQQGEVEELRFFSVSALPENLMEPQRGPFAAYVASKAK
ncbi:MAG: NUDIX domain-containing protein [Clostridia bacterium]|nr:NUDIX domain-containing protein [Clostridia bacterium]